MRSRGIRWIVVLGLALVLCGGLGVPFAQARSPAESSATGSNASLAGPTRAGLAGTVQGVTETLAKIQSRSAPAKNATPREASPLRSLSGAARESAPAVGQGVVDSAQGKAVPNSPQTPVDKILGPKFTDTLGFVPPDTMGAVGPTQFLFSVNTRLRAFNKNVPHTQIFDLDEQAFWGATASPTGVSATHVRYDRTSGRWFITEIDHGTVVGQFSGNNHILLAVSSSSDLATATWTKFAIPATGADAAHDNGCFADHDTPGIDQHAIYVGANMFGGINPCFANYLHSNLYVIQKASALTNTLQYSQFFNVVASSSAVPATIHGVDSVDPLPTGFVVGVNETESPRQHLNVWQVVNPGTVSPTLSGPTAVVIAPENGTLGGVLSHNNVVSANPTRPMDDLDDRLFAAVIRGGHLWTAHNVAVDASGNANGTPTRDAVRWYDVNLSGLTLNQSGTVFDGAATNFQNYWMGTVMVSGQGHVAMGLNRANPATDVQAGAVGRLAGDPDGTMGAFSLFQTSTADPYTDSSFVSNPSSLWGHYTYTSLDPCDDMTMWTAQEYVAGNATPFDWGVAAERLQAPPPATPSLSVPGAISEGLTNVNVVITGTAINGSGFYDTPATITDPCRTRLTAAVSSNVKVNSVTYIDPTHLQLNISTTGATVGLQTVTITNPDGQSAAAAVLRIAHASTTTLTSAPSPSQYGQQVTFTATVSGPGGTPTGTVAFSDGVTLLGNGTLSGGVATFSTSTLAVGPHTITATYGGDVVFADSTSSLDITVNPLASSTTLSSAPSPSEFGQLITLTATVGGSGTTPTGSVAFYDGATLLGNGALLNGVATFTTSTLAVGPHALTATYSGDAIFAGGSSSILNISVNRTSSTTTLTSAPSPTQFGQQVTFTATVSGPGATPTGTVAFSDGVTLLGNGALSGGVATFTTTTLAVGPHAVKAMYVGDVNFNGSTSNVLNITVNPAHVYLPIVRN